MSRAAVATGGAARHAQRLPITPANRLWRHVGATVSAIGPVHGLDDAGVLGAVRRLAAAGPHTLVGLTADPTGRSWRYDPAGLAEVTRRMVRSAPAPDPSGIDALVDRLAATADPALPLQVVVAGDWLALVNQHVLGDGTQVMRWMTALVGLAQGGPLPSWCSAPPTTHPLATALRHTFLDGRPGLRRWRQTLDERRAGVSSGATTPASTGPDAIWQPWQPCRAAVSARGEAAARDAMRAWARRHAPAADPGSLLVVALRRALRAEGVPVADAVTVAVDARRYLPRGAQVPGNFAATTTVAPQPADDPEALAAAIARSAAAGRPLAAMAASAATAYLAGLGGSGGVGRSGRSVRRGGEAPQRWQPGPAQLGFSWFGRQVALERLGWAVTPDQRRLAGSVDPGGPHAVNVCAFVLGGGLHLFASFHASSFPADAVRRAVQAVAGDPVALLVDGAR